MAASPVSITRTPVSNRRRRPLAITQRRLEANRRNAARSTGPRSAEGKAKVARNPIKHGFFVARERWTSQQQRDFEETFAGLRDDFQPASALEESCVRTIAESYVRMAAVWRYENIAALRYHQQQARELHERIARADAPLAAHLRAKREQLRRAGLWRPTIPAPREAAAILRYEGRLNRAIHCSIAELKALQNLRIGGSSPLPKTQKQSHYPVAANRVFAAAEELRTLHSLLQKVQKQTHFDASRTENQEPRSAPAGLKENAKANPLSSMFTGNRHQRRRAKALAARRR